MFTGMYATAASAYNWAITANFNTPNVEYIENPYLTCTQSADKLTLACTCRLKKLMDNKCEIMHTLPNPNSYSFPSMGASGSC